MGNSKLAERVRHLLEVVFTTLLFGAQTILNAGISIGIMAIPLLPYLFYLLTGMGNYPEAVATEIWAMFYLDTFIVGRIIALIGVVVLLLAAAQLFWSRHKGVALIKTGAYSMVRHPQFSGIIIVTFGLTVMVLTNSTASLFQTAGLWLVQILGYIALARYDEAIRTYDKAIEMASSGSFYAPMAWIRKGNALQTQGKNEEALEAYNKAIDLNPIFADAWQGRGEAQKALGKVTEASGSFYLAKKLGYEG
jgi:tetratricopeptide (TPR) repeat protein